MYSEVRCLHPYLVFRLHSAVVPSFAERRDERIERWNNGVSGSWHFAEWPCHKPQGIPECWRESSLPCPLSGLQACPQSPSPKTRSCQDSKQAATENGRKPSVKLRSPTTRSPQHAELIAAAKPVAQAARESLRPVTRSLQQAKRVLKKRSCMHLRTPCIYLHARAGVLNKRLHPALTCPVLRQQLLRQIC